MFKRIGIVALVVGGCLFLLKPAGLGSYVATAFHNVRGTFKKQVPLEFEIDRLRYQVAQLVPDMKKQLNTVAEKMVAIQNLKEEVVDARINLQRQKDAILTMTNDLEKGAVVLTYDGREYPAQRIQAKLERDMESYKTADEAIKVKEKLLEAEEGNLDATRETLASIKTQKQTLEVEVARLETELKSIRLAQTHTKFQFDDTGLAQCKQTLAEIKSRLRVEKTATELQGQFANDNAIAVEKKSKSKAEVIKDVNAYFNPSKKIDQDDGVAKK